MATAIGGVDFQALRPQVIKAKMEIEACLDQQPAGLAGHLGAPPETLFGVFGTTWYHKLQLPGVAEFVAKWQAAYRDGPIPVPGNVSYNGYMATRELFNAIRRAESTNNIKIIHQLEGLKIPARDRHAALRRLHEFQHPSDAADDLSRARAIRSRANATDSFEIVSCDRAPGRRRSRGAGPVPSCVPDEQVPVVDSVRAVRRRRASAPPP